MGADQIELVIVELVFLILTLLHGAACDQEGEEKRMENGEKRRRREGAPCCLGFLLWLRQLL